MKKSLLFIFTGLLLFLSSQTAFSHSAFVSGNPSAGADLSEAPAEVKLMFNENLLLLGEANPNKLEVISANGELVSGAVTVTGPEIFVPVDKDLAVSGEYTVRYRVVSADGHPVEGDYNFTITGPEVISAPVQEELEDGPNLLVRLGFALLLLGIGALALLRLRK